MTRAFGITVDIERGTTRNWVMGGDGVKRWVDNMAPIYDSLLKGQEPLGAEFEAIWDANVGNLYEP